MYLLFWSIDFLMIQTSGVVCIVIRVNCQSSNYQKGELKKKEMKYTFQLPFNIQLSDYGATTVVKVSVQMQSTVSFSAF